MDRDEPAAPRSAPVRITDGVVTIRTPGPADADAVAAAVQSSMDELRPWMPWATPGYDAASAIEWMDAAVAAGESSFVIEAPEGTIVGSTGLNLTDRVNHRANLGYWIATASTGRGLATRAVRLVARHGFETLRLHRLEILMSVENVPSRRVAERAGATYEGVLRGRLLLNGHHHDAHSFALLATDTPSPTDAGRG